MAERRKSVIPSSFVIAFRGRTRRFVEQAVGLEPANGSIEVAGLELDCAVCVLDDVLPNAVAMSVASGQHGEHENFDRLERYERSGVFSNSHDASVEYSQFDYRRLTITCRKGFEINFRTFWALWACLQRPVAQCFSPRLPILQSEPYPTEGRG